MSVEQAKLRLMDRAAQDGDIAIIYASPAFGEGFVFMTVGTPEGYARLDQAIAREGCTATVERETGRNRQVFVECTH